MLTFIEFPKGETPTDRDGMPDNYRHVAFPNNQAKEHFQNPKCNYQKHSMPYKDYLVWKDGTVVETGTWLEAMFMFEEEKVRMPKSYPVWRVRNYAHHPFSKNDIEKIKKEVEWYGNH